MKKVIFLLVLICAVHGLKDNGKRGVNVNIKVNVSSSCGCCHLCDCAAPGSTDDATTPPATPSPTPPIFDRQHLVGPLTNDFSNWLSASRFASQRDHFLRTDIAGNNGNVYGSYGGRTVANQPINNDPVIFFHANSFKPLDDFGSIPTRNDTGFTSTISYFLSQGYTSAELYGTTYGFPSFPFVFNNTFNCQHLTQLRAFTEAVLEYTGASKIDIISHIMGVPLARKVVKGGAHTDDYGNTCNLGNSLTANVDTFLGIGGPNYGMQACFIPAWSQFRVCNHVNGMYPGYCPDGTCPDGGIGFPVFGAPALSAFLADLNEEPHRFEGDHVYSMYDTIDAVIGYLVWGSPTSRIPGEDGAKVFETFGHTAGIKDDTVYEQLQMVKFHRII